MSDLKQLAETQGGVIYIEQLEEWLEKVVEELEEEKEVVKEYEKYHYSVRLEKAIDIVKRGGVK